MAVADTFPGAPGPVDKHKGSVIVLACEHTHTHTRTLVHPLMTFSIPFLSHPHTSLPPHTHTHTPQKDSAVPKNDLTEVLPGQT